jgi:hypothetical protein
VTEGSQFKSPWYNNNKNGTIRILYFNHSIGLFLLKNKPFYYSNLVRAGAGSHAYHSMCVKQGTPCVLSILSWSLEIELRSLGLMVSESSHLVICPLHYPYLFIYLFIYLLGIFFIYISNAISKSPIPSLPLPYPPTPTSWPWRSPVLKHIKFATPMGLSFHWWPTRPSSDTYAARVMNSRGYWLVHIVVPPIGLQTPLAPWVLSLAPPLGALCDPSNSWLWASTSVFARPRHSLTRDSYVWVLSRLHLCFCFYVSTSHLLGVFVFLTWGQVYLTANSEILRTGREKCIYLWNSWDYRNPWDFRNSPPVLSGLSYLCAILCGFDSSFLVLNWSWNLRT